MKKAKPPAALRGEEKKAQAVTKRIESSTSAKEPMPEYEARSIDAALDLLTIATAPAGASTSSDKLDRHPERRMKAAYAAYEEKYLPILKVPRLLKQRLYIDGAGANACCTLPERDHAQAENPGLRLSQLKERLFKQWQKAPENPLNQSAGRYDLTAEEERELTAAQRDARLESMRVDSERQQRRLSAGDDEALSAKKAGKAKKTSSADASSSEGEE